MSLYLHFSSSFENLAHKLADTIRTSSERDPFATQTVIVPNQSVKLWLQLQIAKKNGVTANIDFHYFEVGLWNLIQQLDHFMNPDKRTGTRLLDEKQLTLLIMHCLQDSTQSRDDNSTIFQSYIVDEHGINNRKIWQLATRLAKLLGHYEYHRSQWLWDWQKNNRISESDSSRQSLIELEHAERKLYYDIFGADGIRAQIKNATEIDHLLIAEYAARIFSYKKLIRTPREHVPVQVFGMTRLTPRDVNCLFQISHCFNLHMYQYSVCCEFWEDIPTRSQQRKLRALEFERIRKLRLPMSDNELRPNIKTDFLENPLLQAWGHAGRETLVLFSEFEERFQNQVNCEGEWLAEESADKGNNSVLHELQHNIRHRLLKNTRVKPDKSLQIIACPSIYREVEMVYHTIIHNMETNPELKLTDIAVMVTNLKEYKPAIDYVFSGSGQVPYNLNDGNAAVESIYGQAMISMLTLALGDFTRKELFNLIFNPCFLAGINATRLDAVQWLEWTDSLGIFRNFETEYQTDTQPFSWTHGLTRLRFGRIMTDEIEFNDKTFPDFKGIVPYSDMESSNQDSVGKFSFIIESLFKHLIPLKSANLNLSQWRQNIQKLDGKFIDIPVERSNELVIRKKLLEFFQDSIIFDQLNLETNTLSLQLLIEIIKSGLVTIPSRKGTILSHGISIFALRPMRPIPFRLVYILGMKEGEFPGARDESMLDLRRFFHPRPGDVDLTDANRYTFLETLMSAQEKLYISYVSRDLKKEEDFYPCSVLKQLIHYLDNHVLTSEQPVIDLPLKGNSGHYLDTSNPDNDYSDVYETYSRTEKLQALSGILNRIESSDGNDCKSAENISFDDFRNRVVEQLNRTLPSFEFHPVHQEELPKRQSISLRDLAKFLENPIEAGLHFHLTLFNDRHETKELEENEPFFSSYPRDWVFEIDVLETFIRQYSGNEIDIENKDVYLDNLHTHWQQCSLVPADNFGDLNRRHFAENISERITGSVNVKNSLVDLLDGQTSNGRRLLSHVTLGNVDSVQKSDLRLSAFVFDIVNPEREQSQTIELIGSLPFVWQNLNDGCLNACLKLTAKSEIKQNKPSWHILEPYLFFITLNAAGKIPEGTEFTVFLSHKKGIFPKSYTAGSIENAKQWLAQLVSSFLGKDRFDLLPYSIITSIRDNDLTPWKNNNPATNELQKRYQEQISAAIETTSDKDYHPPEILNLINPVVPEDAFTKVRDRLGPILG